MEYRGCCTDFVRLVQCLYDLYKCSYTLYNSLYDWLYNVQARTRLYKLYKIRTNPYKYSQLNGKVMEIQMVYNQFVIAR